MRHHSSLFLLVVIFLVAVEIPTAASIDRSSAGGATTLPSQYIPNIFTGCNKLSGEVPQDLAETCQRPVGVPGAASDGMEIYASPSVGWNTSAFGGKGIDGVIPPAPATSGDDSGEKAEREMLFDAVTCRDPSAGNLEKRSYFKTFYPVNWIGFLNMNAPMNGPGKAAQQEGYDSWYNFAYTTSFTFGIISVGKQSARWKGLKVLNQVNISFADVISTNDPVAAPTAPTSLDSDYWFASGNLGPEGSAPFNLDVMTGEHVAVTVRQHLTKIPTPAPTPIPPPPTNVPTSPSGVSGGGEDFTIADDSSSSSTNGGAAPFPHPSHHSSSSSSRGIPSGVRVILFDTIPKDGTVPAGRIGANIVFTATEPEVLTSMSRHYESSSSTIIQSALLNFPLASPLPKFASADFSNLHKTGNLNSYWCTLETDQKSSPLISYSLGSSMTGSNTGYGFVNDTDYSLVFIHDIEKKCQDALKGGSGFIQPSTVITYSKLKNPSMERFSFVVLDEQLMVCGQQTEEKEYCCTTLEVPPPSSAAAPPVYLRDPIPVEDWTACTMSSRGGLVAKVPLLATDSTFGVDRNNNNNKNLLILGDTHLYAYGNESKSELAENGGKSRLQWTSERPLYTFVKDDSKTPPPAQFHSKVARSHLVVLPADRHSLRPTLNGVALPPNITIFFQVNTNTGELEGFSRDFCTAAEGGRIGGDHKKVREDPNNQESVRAPPSPPSGGQSSSSSSSSSSLGGDGLQFEIFADQINRKLSVRLSLVVPMSAGYLPSTYALRNLHYTSDDNNNSNQGTSSYKSTDLLYYVYPNIDQFPLDPDNHVDLESNWARLDLIPAALNISSSTGGATTTLLHDDEEEDGDDSIALLSVDCTYFPLQDSSLEARDVLYRGVSMKTGAEVFTASHNVGNAPLCGAKTLASTQNGRLVLSAYENTIAAPSATGGGVINHTAVWSLIVTDTLTGGSKPLFLTEVCPLGLASRVQAPSTTNIYSLKYLAVEGNTWSVDDGKDGVVGGVFYVAISAHYPSPLCFLQVNVQSGSLTSSTGASKQPGIMAKAKYEQALPSSAWSSTGTIVSNLTLIVESENGDDADLTTTSEKKEMRRLYLSDVTSITLYDLSSKFSLVSELDSNIAFTWFALDTPNKTKLVNLPITQEESETGNLLPPAFTPFFFFGHIYLATDLMNYCLDQVDLSTKWIADPFLTGTIANGKLRNYGYPTFYTWKGKIYEVGVDRSIVSKLYVRQFDAFYKTAATSATTSSSNGGGGSSSSSTSTGIPKVMSPRHWSPGVPVPGETVLTGTGYLIIPLWDGYATMGLKLETLQPTDEVELGHRCYFSGTVLGSMVQACYKKGDVFLKPQLQLRISSFTEGGEYKEWKQTLITSDTLPSYGSVLVSTTAASTPGSNNNNGQAQMSDLQELGDANSSKEKQKVTLSVLARGGIRDLSVGMISVIQIPNAEVYNVTVTAEQTTNAQAQTGTASDTGNLQPPTSGGLSPGAIAAIILGVFVLGVVALIIIVKSRSSSSSSTSGSSSGRSALEEEYLPDAQRRDSSAAAPTAGAQESSSLLNNKTLPGDQV